MDIIVCVKQVPDAKDVRLDPETNTLAREGVEAIMNPFDRHALEEAVSLKEQLGGKVTVLSMGPPQAEDALREAIAMGADEAILLSDRAFAGADTLATAYTLAEAIRRIGDYDLVICGRQAIDGDAGQVPVGVLGILPLGIDHGDGIRQLVLRLVMVGDYDVDAEALRQSDLFVPRHAAVDRHDQLDAAVPRNAHAVRGEPVAVREPVGNVETDLESGGLETPLDDNHRGYAIDVVVAADEDFLLLVDGQPQPLESGLDVGQQERIVKNLTVGVEERVRVTGGRHAVPDEHGRERSRNVHLGRELDGSGLLVLVRKSPSALQASLLFRVGTAVVIVQSSGGRPSRGQAPAAKERSRDGNSIDGADGKPSSVGSVTFRGDHSSGTPIARRLMRPTREL